MFRGGAYIDPSQDAAAIPAGANISATLVSEKYPSIGASIPLTAYEGTSGASAKITSTSSALAFPLTSIVDKTLELRNDKINDGKIKDQILKNSPDKNEEFFIVPKVVE